MFLLTFEDRERMVKYNLDFSRRARYRVTIQTMSTSLILSRSCGHFSASASLQHVNCEETTECSLRLITRGLPHRFHYPSGSSHLLSIDRHPLLSCDVCVCRPVPYHSNIHLPVCTVCCDDADAYLGLPTNMEEERGCCGGEDIGVGLIEFS